MSHNHNFGSCRTCGHPLKSGLSAWCAKCRPFSKIGSGSAPAFIAPHPTITPIPTKSEVQIKARTAYLIDQSGQDRLRDRWVRDSGLE